MDCYKCPFWVNDKCTDDIEWINEYGEAVCRFHLDATQKKSDRAQMADELRERFKGQHLIRGHTLFLVIKELELKA